jgi:hypothetical protein
MNLCRDLHEHPADGLAESLPSELESEDEFEGSDRARGYHDAGMGSFFPVMGTRPHPLLGILLGQSIHAIS